MPIWIGNIHKIDFFAIKYIVSSTYVYLVYYVIVSKVLPILTSQFDLTLKANSLDLDRSGPTRLKSSLAYTTKS